MTESHEQASINHPIRRLRRHLPYLGKVKHQAASPQFPSLPFQALRASFPEGKPSRVRFEEHVGLTDERNLGQLTLSVNADLPEKASPKFGQAPKATEGLYYLTSRK